MIEPYVVVSPAVSKRSLTASRLPLRLVSARARKMPLISLLAMDAENTIRRFFDAMNTGDADAVAALVDPSIVIRMGPQSAEGVEAVREIASQTGPEALSSTVEIVKLESDGGRFEITARRVQRWAETNELASEEKLKAVFYLDEHGLVTRAELDTKPPDE